MKIRKLFLIGLTTISLAVMAPVASAQLPAWEGVIDGCGDAGGGSTDIAYFEAGCSSSSLCYVYVELCAWPPDPLAKYRVHFDTEEYYFYEDSNNEDCLTTSEDTVMYRPIKDKYTGPDIWMDQSGTSCYYCWFSSAPVIWWYFEQEELGINPGDYVAAWMDVHYKGNVDRAPNTDDTDGCDKPQYRYDAINVNIPIDNGGEALEFCANWFCD